MKSLGSASDGAEFALRENLTRWRLILGRDADSQAAVELDKPAAAMDRALEALYRGGPAAGPGRSAPKLNKWLGDIRRYFPTPVIRMIQKDAIERYGIRELLLEPELLEQIEPDIQLAAAILSLKNALPEKTRATASLVVEKLVAALIRRLQAPFDFSVKGQIDRASYHFRPGKNDLDWQRTIRLNLRHYQPDNKRIVPERLVGNKRRNRQLKHVILLVDQSASMAQSVVYAGIIGSMLASLPSVRTHFVLFDTEIADVSEQIDDPVALLFAAQMGGGTDISKALLYAEGLVTRPLDTTVFCVTDLDEGGDEDLMISQFYRLRERGIRTVCLLGIDDSGRLSYNHAAARKLSAIDVPCLAATPDAVIEMLGDILRGA